ncbi:hypothetical protein L218DRAFT_1054285 [Marasmius fiardii PR-910]|nr:hypothetical protein L218DRAFT_1054285 [Marasmius fiardii PR-910]
MCMFVFHFPVVLIFIGFVTWYFMFSSSKNQSVSQATLRGSRCHTVLGQTSFSSAVRQSFAWVMAFIYDGMVFVLAIWIAFKTRKEVKFRRRAVSLKTILGGIRAGLAPFANSHSVTLASRLMLNLHQVVDNGVYAGPYATRGLW